MHVILDSSVYNDLKITLFDKASDVCPGFNDLNSLEKFKIFIERTQVNSFLCRFCAGNHSSETTAILTAMADLKAEIDSKMDQIDKSNKDSIRMVQEQIGSIKKEFNSRIDDLARKVEGRMMKMFECLKKISRRQ